MILPFSEELCREIIGDEVGVGIFDSSGRLERHSPNLRGFLLDPGNALFPGQRIPDLFPELIGYEEVLRGLQERREQDLYIGRVFRPALRGKDGYVSFRVKAYRDGWLVIVQDATVAGKLEQRVVQQRNELDLLSAKLASANSTIDKLLRKFVPPTVVDDMLRKGTAKLGGGRRIVSVLFADLRGYTAWAEALTPEEAIERLNTLLSSAAEILNENKATINQLMGDGFMSIFNAPIDQPNHAALALESAKQIANLPGIGQFVQFGVGVNTGIAMVGNVGSQRFMDYSAIGTTTNIAYRLQQLAGPGEALFGEQTRELAGDQFPHTSFGLIEVKGIKSPIPVYKLLP